MKFIVYTLLSFSRLHFVFLFFFAFMIFFLSQQWISETDGRIFKISKDLVWPSLLWVSIYLSIKRPTHEKNPFWYLVGPRPSTGTRRTALFTRPSSSTFAVRPAPWFQPLCFCIRFSWPCVRRYFLRAICLVWYISVSRQEVFWLWQTECFQVVHVQTVPSCPVHFEAHFWRHQQIGRFQGAPKSQTEWEHKWTKCFVRWFLVEFYSGWKCLVKSQVVLSRNVRKRKLPLSGGHPSTQRAMHLGKPIFVLGNKNAI